MAEPRPVDQNNLNFSVDEVNNQPVYRRLSLLNGLLIGLAVGLGAWGLEALQIARLPVTSYLPALFLGLGLIVVLCGLAGLLTGRIARTPVTILFWAITGVVCMLIMTYIPYYGRSVVVWLADSRFWGREVFPYILEATTGSLILAGFFIILALAALGLLQNYRLENLTNEVSHRNRLSGRGWVSLLWPLPIVFLASLITHNTMSNPAATAAELTNRAITQAQLYEGDLRELNLGDGISYAALRPVQEMIDGEYTLSIVDVNPLTSTVIIGADFAGGAWVYCRVINGQLTFCYDATPAYTIGLRSLITGEALPENCRGCALRVTDEAAAWLAERRDQMGSDLAIERAAQQGSHVLMRVTGDNGFVVECWIVGTGPTELTACREAME